MKVMNESSEVVPSKSYDVHVEKSMGVTLFEAETRSIFMDAYQQQQIGDNDPKKPFLPVFTFVRDPLTRFLSGLAQYLELGVRNNNALNKCTRRHRETVPLLECVVVQQIHSHQSYLNNHLQPQAYAMYKAIYGNDLAFQLIQLDDLESTLVALLGVETTPIRKERVRFQQSGGSRRTLLQPYIHKRLDARAQGENMRLVQSGCPYAT